MKNTNNIYSIFPYIKNDNVVHLWNNCFVVAFIRQISISAEWKLKRICFQPIINTINAMKQLAMYRDIEISEKQIEAGQVKDARTALRETRVKYGL